MSVPTDNNISVKEYNNVSEDKDLEKVFVKVWHHKSNTVQVLL